MSRLAAMLFAVMLLVFTAGAERADALEVDTSFRLNGGYRTDELDWSVGGNESYWFYTYTWKSDLSWKDLDIWQLELDGEATLEKVWLIKGSFDYGWISSGRSRDSDYEGYSYDQYYSSGLQEWARSLSDVDGNVWDASLSAGYKFLLFQPSEEMAFWLIPRVGYSYSTQNLEDENLDYEIPDLGRIYSGSVSTYEARWYGPFLGLDLSFQATAELEFFTGVEYHWADYRGKANWKLRDDYDHPVSFRHYSEGDGIVLTAGSEYTVLVTDLLDIGVSLTFNYRNWQAGKGLDRTFYPDGTYADVGLSEVNWDSYSIMLGTSLGF